MKKKLLIASLLTTIAFNLVHPPLTGAVWEDYCTTPVTICYPNDDGTCTEVEDKLANIRGFECIFKRVLNNIVGFAGVAVLVMLIYGGYMFSTAGSDPKNTAKAASVITYAIVGLVVMVLSWFLLRFTSIFTGITDFLNFRIPGP